MPASPIDKKSTDTAEGFLGSVFKYSISTFVNIGIFGLGILLTAWFVPTEIHNQATIFISWTNTIMTVGILGLDQALMRFYREPPAGLSPNGLFRLCFYFSSLVLWLGGAVCSTLLMRPIYAALGFSAVGHGVIPLLFLNAFFYMVARYFSVLYRMEGNIAVYTVVTILMQFFYKLFYILGRFWGPNPVWSMILCSVAGLGGFALVFSFMRRSTLRPRIAELKSGAYKTLLPYGAAIAPTAVMVTLNYSLSQSLLTNRLGNDLAGVYAFAYTLSNVVTVVQGGFASFWGPYMFEHYKTQQQRIKRVHNYLNLVILLFFALLVAFEDVLFWVLRVVKDDYMAAMPIFPLMMLSAVFTILCETTVYGNAIARRPIFDTIGIALSFGCNVLFILLLAPPLGLTGAALAIALANFVMFVFRTVTGQLFYRSIPSYPKTVLAVLLALALAVCGTVFAHHFLIKLLCSAAAAAGCVLLYPKELVHLVRVLLNFVKGLFKRG